MEKNYKGKVELINAEGKVVEVIYTTSREETLKVAASVRGYMVHTEETVSL